MPTAFIALLELARGGVAVGDDVEILGFRVDLGGGSVLLAREIKKSERTLTLRDTSGDRCGAARVVDNERAGHRPL